jgi:hypothetical protein
MPYRARAAEVLARWRETERQHDAATDLDERALLEAELARLRDEYQQAVDDALAAHAPTPPPFAEVANLPDDPPDVTTLTPPKVDGQTYGG